MKIEVQIRDALKIVLDVFGKESLKAVADFANSRITLGEMMDIIHGTYSTDPPPIDMKKSKSEFEKRMLKRKQEAMKV